jgi:hypothetical protein
MISIFVSLKKKQQLRIKGQIGSFICNSRGSREEAERMLKEMKFFMSFPWHYDPYGIISEMRVKNKNIPYVHESKPEIEKFANQKVWVPDTLVEVEQQVPPTTVPPMNTPQVPKEKRPRQESSPPVTEVSSEEFQLHTKRPKTTTVPGPTVEKRSPAYHSVQVFHSTYSARSYIRKSPQQCQRNPQTPHWTLSRARLGPS